MSTLADDLRESIRLAQRRRIAALESEIGFLQKRGRQRDVARICRLRNLIAGLERDMRQGVLIKA